MNKKRMLATLLALIIGIIAIMPANALSAEKQPSVTDYEAVFNSDFYANMYPDVKAAYGNDYAKLLYHFITCGMSEGRQGNEDFNVYVYMERYPDLKKKYKNDLKSYYVHYMTSGKKEGRSGRLDGKAPSNKVTTPVPTAPSKLAGGKNMNFTQIAAYDFSNNMFSGAEFANYDLTMVNCFTTWCGYCVREMPDIQQLYASLPANVNIVAICFDAADNPQGLNKIVNNNGLTFTVLRGNSYQNIPFNASTLVSGWPTTFFVNSKGQIVDSMVGAPRNPVAGYKSAMNKCLRAMGKKTIK